MAPLSAVKQVETRVRGQGQSITAIAKSLHARDEKLAELEHELRETQEEVSSLHRSGGDVSNNSLAVVDALRDRTTHELSHMKKKHASLEATLHSLQDEIGNLKKKF